MTLNSNLSFTCENHILKLNVELYKTDCSILVDNHSNKSSLVETNYDTSCVAACDDIAASVPTYDEFLSLNYTRIHELMADEGPVCPWHHTKCIDPPPLELQVRLGFDFERRLWQSNGHPVSNITWTSVGYPKITDLLTICFRNVQKLNMTTSAADNVPKNPFASSNPVAFYCTTSSSTRTSNRSDFYDSDLYYLKYSHHLDNDAKKALYFCTDDPLDIAHLKYGTYNEANDKCNHRLLTPDICSQKNKIKLLNLVMKGMAEVDLNFFGYYWPIVARLWTGARRYNQTHFIGDRILSPFDLG